MNEMRHIKLGSAFAEALPDEHCLDLAEFSPGEHQPIACFLELLPQGLLPDEI